MLPWCWSCVPPFLTGLIAGVLLSPATRGTAGDKSTFTNSLGMTFLRIDASALTPRAGVYHLGAHEITQDQYRKVTGKNPSWFQPGGGGKGRVRGMDTLQFPVEMVSWQDADTFCRLLSARSVERAAGRSYRLPTEAEWEFACRAGGRTAFAHGDSLSSDQANFNGYFPDGGADRGQYLGRTTRVGSYQPNRWGLHDMHGNVWEWCADAVGEHRVLRGGSWYGGGRLCRANHRATAWVGERYWNIGFRIVCVTVPSR